MMDDGDDDDDDDDDYDDDDDDDDHIAFAGLGEGGVGTDVTVCLESTYF